MQSTNEQTDSVEIAHRVKELLDRHHVPKRAQAMEVSKILGLSFSQAHRKLKGQSPWTINQVREMAEAFNESPGVLVESMSEGDGPARGIGYPAVLAFGNDEVGCMGYIAQELLSGQQSDFVALKQGNEWRIYRADQAPAGKRYRVDLIEIRSRQSEAEKPHIAVVDDSEEVADELCGYFRSKGFNSTAFYDVKTFRKALAKDAFDGYVMDWLIGDETAAESIAAIRASENADAPVIVLTGVLDAQSAQSAISQAIKDFDVLGPMEKPIKPALISATLERYFSV
ncbi:TPA: helix-turn-helix domain-containing protein [Burkholderia cepacia]